MIGCSDRSGLLPEGQDSSQPLSLKPVFHLFFAADSCSQAKAQFIHLIYSGLNQREKEYEKGFRSHSFFKNQICFASFIP